MARQTVNIEYMGLIVKIPTTEMAMLLSKILICVKLLLLKYINTPVVIISHTSGLYWDVYREVRVVTSFCEDTSEVLFSEGFSVAVNQIYLIKLYAPIIKPICISSKDTSEHNIIRHFDVVKYLVL